MSGFDSYYRSSWNVTTLLSKFAAGALPFAVVQQLSTVRRAPFREVSTCAANATPLYIQVAVPSMPPSVEDAVTDVTRCQWCGLMWTRCRIRDRDYAADVWRRHRFRGVWLSSSSCRVIAVRLRRLSWTAAGAAAATVTITGYRRLQAPATVQYCGVVCVASWQRSFHVHYVRVPRVASMAPDCAAFVRLGCMMRTTSAAMSTISSSWPDEL